MSRPPVTKKEDLVSAALVLFRKKGVDSTTVADIAGEAHVAQGTFYNYFRSKDDIFAEVLEKATEDILGEMREIAGRKDIGPLQKFKLLNRRDFLLNRKNDSLFDVLHEMRYAYAHQKYLVNRIENLRPIYAGIIRQCVEEGYFDTPYPDEAALYMLTATKFVFDPAFFTFTEVEMMKTVRAVFSFIERIFGAEPGLLAQEEFERDVMKFLRGDGE